MAEGIPTDFRPPVEKPPQMDDFQWGHKKPGEALIDKLRELKNKFSGRSARSRDLSRDLPSESEDVLNTEKETQEQLQSRQEAERRLTEQREIDEELLKNMKYYREGKKQSIFSERVQEISERSFNKSLTKLEDIDIASMLDDGQVTKREVDFNDKKLTVYDLKGFPFSFLQHAIDFKGRGETYRLGELGSKTAKSLQDNPSLWTRKRNEINTVGGEHNNGQSNTISVSYVNLEKNAKLLGSNLLLYGFDHVEPDSILQICISGVGTPNGLGESKTFLTDSRPYLPEILEDPSNNLGTGLNELLIRRYKENGDPKLPDYLIVENGEIPEVILRHAEYFNVPIINIETKLYRDKEASRLMDIIDSVDENTSYKDIRSTLNRLGSSFLIPMNSIHNSTGLGIYQNASHNNTGNNISEEFGEKFRLFLKFEFAKRMEFIKKTLQEETDAINLAISSNEMYFNEKSIYIRKLSHDNNNNYSIDTMHCLEIKIQTEKDSKLIESTIYEGDNPVPGEPKRDGANSRYYNELAPIVDTYLLALEKNRS